jgi:hypothetical protein
MPILKFQRRSFHHITGDDVSKATKGTTNATMVSKAAMLSKVIVATMRSDVIVATL